MNFVYDFGEPLKEYVNNPEITEIHEWKKFTAIGFTKKSNKQKGNKDRVGNFFKYLVHDVPELVEKYLVRLQIFDSLIDESGEVRK